MRKPIEIFRIISREKLVCGSFTQFWAKTKLEVWLFELCNHDFVEASTEMVFTQSLENTKKKVLAT